MILEATQPGRLPAKRPLWIHLGSVGNTSKRYGNSQILLQSYQLLHWFYYFSLDTFSTTTVPTSRPGVLCCARCVSDDVDAATPLNYQVMPHGSPTYNGIIIDRRTEGVTQCHCRSYGQRTSQAIDLRSTHLLIILPPHSTGHQSVTPLFAGRSASLLQGPASSPPAVRMATS